MRTALRKMGNSVGMILPKALLAELGATVGTPMNVRIEGSDVIATPLRNPREGWAEAAALIGAAPLTEEEEDWLSFGNEDDDDWVW